MNSKSFAFLALLAALTTTLPAWANYTFKDGVLTVDGKVDLAGQPLTFEGIKSMTGTGEFTDSVGGGVLTLSVDSSATLTNGKSPCMVKFSDKLKLVKSGAGTLSIANTGSGSISTHSFSGGLEIQSGKVTTAKYGNMDGDTTPFGDKEQTIDIGVGAILDLGGCYGLASTTINLRGGTLANIARTVGTETYYFKAAINVYAESTFLTENKKVFNFAGDLDLHGNTLKLDFGDTFYWHPSSAENGKIKADGGTFLVSAKTDMSTVDLEMNVPMNLKADCSVRDYLANYSGNNTVSGALNVYGSLIPQTDSFYPCTMMNGSTIVIPTTGELPWLTVNSEGQSVKFDAAATVTIDVGTRTFSAGDKIVAWPDGAEYSGRTFKFMVNGAVSEEYELQVSATGLTVAARGAKVPTATWTGAVSADATNPDNWSWANVPEPTPGLTPGGSLNLTPGPTTAVVIPWEKLATLNWPDTDDLSFATVAFSGEKPTETVVLDGDRDWRGLGAMDIPFALDLNGHKLYIVLPGAASVNETAVTSTAEGGELHATVATDKVHDNTSVALTGNLSLIKEGPGTFVQTLTAQSYAGETRVVEGVLATAGGDMSGEGVSLFGTDKSVTVEAGAALDPRGSYNWSDYTIILDGGMISNTVANIGTNNDNTQYNISSANVNRRFNPKVTLLKDSTFATTEAYTFFATVDSNGHELQNWIATSAEVRWQPKTKTEGKPLTMDITGGGKLFILKNLSLNQPTMTLKMSDGWVTMGGDMVVSNYVAASKVESFDYKYTNAVMNVWGTFTPVTQNFVGCTLQDGSTIDLSKQSDSWNSRGYTKLGKDGKNTVKGDVDFAEGATVMIEVGDREFKGVEQIVTWSEGSKASAAKATFMLSAAAKAKGYSLSYDENGLYVGRRGMMLLLR